MSIQVLDPSVEFTPPPPGERKPSPWDLDDFLEKAYSIAEGWRDDTLVGLARGYELGRYLRTLRADPDFDLEPHELLDAAVYFDELYSVGSIGREAIAQIAEGVSVETPGREPAEWACVARRDDWTRQDFEYEDYRYDRRYLTAPALVIDEKTLAPVDGRTRYRWICRPLPPKLSNLNIRSFGTIDFASTVKPALVDELLDREGLSVIFGPSGAGKSFVALDLAICVATGRPWRGKATEQAAVLFVAAEAPTSIERRVLALRQRHGLTDCPVAVVSGNINLFSSDGTAAEIVEAARQTAERFGVRVGWIVVDTLAAATAGSDENTGKDMGAIVGRLQNIQRATGAHVTVIHHSGKDESKGARGHSSLRAAVDTEISVRDGLAEVTKLRDGELGDTFGFRIESVVVGQREDGKLVEAGVLVQESAANTLRRRPLKGRLKDAADALQTALENNGVAPPAGAGFSENIGHVVNSDEWREAFAMATKGDVAPRSVKDSFRRARDKLATMGRVEIREGFCGFRA